MGSINFKVNKINFNKEISLIKLTHTKLYKYSNKNLRISKTNTKFSPINVSIPRNADQRRVNPHTNNKLKFQKNRPTDKTKTRTFPDLHEKKTPPPLPFTEKANGTPKHTHFATFKHRRAKIKRKNRAPSGRAHSRPLCMGLCGGALNKLSSALCKLHEQMISREQVLRVRTLHCNLLSTPFFFGTPRNSGRP